MTPCGPVLWTCVRSQSLSPGHLGLLYRERVGSLAFLASHTESLRGAAGAGSPCTVSRYLLSPPNSRHKEEVYENVHSKSKKEEKVKKQRSADKEKNKGSLKRK